MDSAWELEISYKDRDKHFFKEMEEKEIKEEPLKCRYCGGNIVDSEWEKDSNCLSCGKNYFGTEQCNYCGKFIHDDNMIIDDDNVFCNDNCQEEFNLCKFHK